MKSFYTTSPLPYADDFDNQVYHPFDSPFKRAKSMKSMPFFTPRVRRGLRRRPSRPLSPRARFYPIDTDSDQDLLPDLTSDELTPDNSPVNPLAHKHVFLPDVISTKPCLLEQLRQQLAASQVFGIPELVHKIVMFADAQNCHIPQEGSPVRRRPLSVNHAFLIHGNHSEAKRIMSEPAHPQPRPRTQGPLFNLLQVNRMFYDITRMFLHDKLYFDDELRFAQFLHSLRASTHKPQPTVFVLHKLFTVRQSTIELLRTHIDFSKCRWLEFYMCPKLYPSFDFLLPSLERLVITGSKKLDDDFLIRVSQTCTSLKVLDIRACELVSDSGIYHIGSRCFHLTNINFGRKSKGALITDTSMNKLIKNNPFLLTVGLAGCHVTDRTMWDLAIYCNESLTRLSVNDCPFITNQSIPAILNCNFYWQNLSVLELRFVKHITQFRSMIEFKRRQDARGILLLVELCESMMMGWRAQEVELDKAVSHRIMSDILDFVHADDDDVDFHSLR